MNCNCSEYGPITLDRESIDRRIKATPKLLKNLEILAVNAALGLKLFRCVACDQFWQSGHEWNFRDEEYLFQVPSIDTEAWNEEPYMQPAAMMIFSALMEDFFAKADLGTGTSLCKRPDCGKHAVSLTAFCPDHYIESLQARGTLPVTPRGRLFPPYLIGANEG